MRITLLIILGAVLAGCASNVQTGGESSLRDSNEKVKAEAYLFDARLYQDKKPTSFRWEIYQTDSVIGMAGRAYLGKGAFKGRVTKDTVSFYFPTSNEYLVEPIFSLLSKDSCLKNSAGLSIFELFFDLPDSILEHSKIRFSVSEKNERLTYLVNASNCDWSLELTYREQKKGWRLEKMNMKSGENRLKASLRTYKASSNIPLSKFQVIFPPQATRISL